MRSSMAVFVIITIGFAVLACVASKPTTGAPTAYVQEADSDGGIDAPDSAQADMLAYLRSVAAARCGKIQTCCGATVIDMGKCESAYGPNGTLPQFGNLNVAAQTAEASPNVAYNSARGNACLADIEAIDCAVLDGPSWVNANNDCASSIQGTIATGDACTYQFECAGDAWCSGLSGAKVCTAIGGVGSACGNDKTSWACMTHGFGTQAQFCDTAATQTCLAQLPNGSPDPYPLACQSELAQNATCVASITPNIFFGPQACSFFALGDGG